MRSSKWFRLLVVAVASLFVFAACGGDDGGDTEATEEEAPQEVPVEEFAGDFCTGMTDWQTAIQDRVAALQELNASGELSVEDRKTELGTYLGDVRGINDEFIGEIEAAGIPEVEGGEEAVNQIIEGFQQVSSEIEEIEGQVGDLPTGSAEEFEAAAQGVIEPLQAAFQSASETLSTLEPESLRTSINEHEACSQLQT